MEQNKEMTAQESLSIIAESLNNSRRDILRSSAKYFILWGIVLTLLSLSIYLCWHLSGNPTWNFLWFAMPVIGYSLALVLGKKDQGIPKSELGRIVGYVWTVFGAFAMCLSCIAVFAIPMHVTMIIVIIMGLAESISGVLLKNWPVIIAGFILGVGGAVFAMLVKSDAQLLIFTLGGALLAVTGLIVRHQYK